MGNYIPYSQLCSKKWDLGWFWKNTQKDNQPEEITLCENMEIWQRNKQIDVHCYTEVLDDINNGMFQISYKQK